MKADGRATDVLSQRPNCDICAMKPAAVDAATRRGPWAYMCEECYGRNGFALGTGRGQVLLCGDERDEALIKRYNLEVENDHGR